MAMSSASTSSAAETRSILADTSSPSKGSNGSAAHAPMATMPIAAVRVGREDARGVAIDQVFAVKEGAYAIYRGPDRMMVHFADDAALANEQRKNLNALAGARAKLAVLTGDLARSRAYYDGQIAHALQLALDGEGEKAKKIMVQTVKRAEEERASRGRIQYLLYSLTTAAVFLVILGIGYAAVSFAKPANNLWLAAIGGAIGAVFSMSIAIRSRTVALDLNRNANIADGALRILVGVIAAGVLILLMATNIIPKLQVGGGALTGEAATWETILLVGFIAGFLERLLPDILSDRRDAEATAEDASPV